MATPKIIQIGEHFVPLPPLPKKSEILNHDKKPADSFWRRQQFPKLWYEFNPACEDNCFADATLYDEDGILIAVGVEDSIMLQNLLQREIHRKMFGVWMKNEEDLVHIAPGYYNSLQWCEMKDLSKPDKPEWGIYYESERDRKFGNFRVPQNKVLTLWDYTKKQNWTAGLTMPKTKKSGITQVVSADFLNDATLYEGMELGAVSKEYDHVVDVFMAYFFHSFDHLPYILQPSIKKRNLSEIVFGTPPTKAGQRKKTGRNLKKDLNSRMNAYKTKSNCFDGPVLKRGFVDECPKMWESSNVHPDTVFVKNIEAVKLNQLINGKLFFTSYMPEIDDIGFTEFKNWCMKSKLSTIKVKGGRTESQLIYYPLTAVESNEECFDKFGRCDEPKALKIVLAERNEKKSIADKLAHRRQYPIDETDMFDSGGKGTVFDNFRIGNQHRDVDSEASTGVPPWQYVTLEWENKDWETGIKGIRRLPGQFGKVEKLVCTDEEIIKSPEDAYKKYPFVWFQEIPIEYVNQVILRNNRHEDDEELCPIPDSEQTPIIGAWDCTDYVLKSDVRDGSMNAGIAGFIYDGNLDARFRKPYTNTPVFEYLFRHEDPNDDYEFLVKFIIYTGCRVVVEANKKWVHTKLKLDKLHHFLLVKYDDGIRPYDISAPGSPVSASKELINDYTRSVKSWLSVPRNEGDVDYLKTYKSLRGMMQLMAFNPEDTKRTDMAVCIGWWRLAIESYITYMLWKKQHDESYGDDAIAATAEALVDF